MYLLKEASYLITQMAVPKNIDVRLPFIFSLIFVPTQMFALVGRLEHLATVNT